MACAAASLGPGRRGRWRFPSASCCGVGARARQRHRRRLPAHPLDDHHARHQRRGAGADGRLYRRLLAAGFRVAADALARHRLRHLGVPNAVIVWAVVGAGAVFLLDAHDLRPRRLRHRQPRARRLSLGRPHAARGDDRLRHLRRAGGLRRRAARRLRLQGGAVDGRCLPAAGDRRRGARRHLDPRRARQLSRHRRRRHPDHAAAVDPVGHADGRSSAGRSSTASSSSPCCCSMDARSWRARLEP